MDCGKIWIERILWIYYPQQKSRGFRISVVNQPTYNTKYQWYTYNTRTYQWEACYAGNYHGTGNTPVLFADYGGVGGQTGRFRCEATDTYGNTITSSEATVTMVRFIPSVTVTETDENQVTITWDQSTDATSYRISECTADGTVVRNLLTVPGTGIQGFSYVLDGVSPGMHYYSVTASRRFSGKTLEDSSLNGITVSGTPLTILTQPVGTTISAGESAAFTIAVNDATASIHWQVSTDGVVWNEPAQGNQRRLTLNPTETCYVRCKVTKDITYVISDTVCCEVLQVPFRITKNLDAAYWMETTSELEISAEGGDLTYQWYVNGEALPEATGNRFILPELNADATVFCRVSSGSDSLDSHTAAIHVGHAPVNGISLYQVNGPDLGHMAVGDLVELAFVLHPVSSETSVVWTSSNESVATVAGGVVRAVGTGSAVITAEANGHAATAALTVDSYRVEYNPNGGVFPDGSTADYNERVTVGQAASLPVVSREGDVFLGWTLDGESVISSYSGNQSVTLCAKWELYSAEAEDELAIVQDLQENQYAKIGTEALFEVVTNGARIRSYTWMVNDGSGWMPYGNGMSNDGSRSSLKVPATVNNNGWKYKVVIVAVKDGLMVESGVVTLSTGTAEPGDQRYTVTYDAGEGQFADGMNRREEKVLVGQTHILGGEEPTRENHSFAGWALNGETVTEFEVYADATVHAVWNEIMHIVPTGSMAASVDGPYPMQVVAVPEGATPAWSVDDDSVAALIVDAEDSSCASLSFLQEGTVTVTVSAGENAANYTVTCDSYYVRYHTNGGHWTFQGETTDGDYSIGLTEPGIASAPGDFLSHQVNGGVAREGYVFAGWSLTPEGDVSLGFNPATDRNLYAVWTVPTGYTVTYDAGEGQFSNGSSTRTDSTLAGMYVFSGEEPTRQGYTFAGWGVQEAYSYETHTVQAIRVSGDVTVSAVWNKVYDLVPTRVSLSQDGVDEDTNSMSSRIYLTSTIEGVDAVDYENLEFLWEESYDRVHWSAVTDNEGMTPALTSCTRWGILQAETVYLRETVNGVRSTMLQVHITGDGMSNYLVQYDANGGSFMDGYTVLVENGYVGGLYSPRPSQEPVRPGYNLLGWSTTRNGQVVDEVEKWSSFWLYAVWEPAVEEYTVTYHANGGNFDTGLTTRTERSSQSTYTLSDVLPVREGYAFDGWMLNGEIVDGTLSPTESITLFAQWKRVYKVTYDLNGGRYVLAGANNIVYSYTVETEPGPYTVVTEYEWHRYPQKDGARFTGWRHPDGSILNAGDTIQVTDDIFRPMKRLTNTRFPSTLPVP